MHVIRGRDLNDEQRKAVLAAFVHRHYAAAVWPTDEVWLEAHAFHFTKRGTLALRHAALPSTLADDINLRLREESRRRSKITLREVRPARERQRVLWVLEQALGLAWLPDTSHETRKAAREQRQYLISEYGADPKGMRIRAYVPDPFLNRDSRTSR